MMNCNTNLNYLTVERVRRKRKSFWDIFALYPNYYEKENISLKEKIYTFYYNMEQTGVTTKGESDWSIRTENINPVQWKYYEELFKKDYWEFISRPI